MVPSELDSLAFGASRWRVRVPFDDSMRFTLLVDFDAMFACGCELPFAPLLHFEIGNRTVTLERIELLDARTNRLCRRQTALDGRPTIDRCTSLRPGRGPVLRAGGTASRVDRQPVLRARRRTGDRRDDAHGRSDAMRGVRGRARTQRVDEPCLVVFRLDVDGRRALPREPGRVRGSLARRGCRSLVVAVPREAPDREHHCSSRQTTVVRLCLWCRMGSRAGEVQTSHRRARARRPVSPSGRRAGRACRCRLHRRRLEDGTTF